MQTYPKISGLYARDMEGSRKLQYSNYASEAVEYLANNQWEWTEKIDGTNIRVYWDGYGVSFAGRTDRAQIPTHLLDRLNELFSSREAEAVFEQLFGGKEIVLFGEGFGHKIQTNGYLDNAVDFILFDVKVGDYWLTRKNVQSIANAFGIRVVPVIFTGTVHEAECFISKHPQSTIGTCPMEGLVGRPTAGLLDRASNRVIVKVKWHDVKEYLEELNDE